MTRFIVLFALAFALTGCLDGTNPFDTDEAEASTAQATTETTDTTSATANTGTTTVTSDTGTAIESDTNRLPGTVNPSAASSIFRTEARTEANDGAGYAEGFAYNSTNDTFTVDNLAFDGDSPYTVVRDANGNRLGIGPFSVFEAEATTADTLTSASVNQFNYRALYSVGPGGDTSVAIVRTGGYIEYGFGGYIFQRNGNVTLPTAGQAKYVGTDNYGGLRDFTGRGGLEYVKGDIEVAIDFDDFNDGSGVRGNVTNRRVYDLDGNDITQTILTAIGVGSTELPTLIFEVNAGALDINGELAGKILSVDPRDGEEFEEGNYYAVLSGDQANTVTGIIVVTGESPRYGTDVNFRETAGFFAVRQ